MRRRSTRSWFCLGLVLCAFVALFWQIGRKYSVDHHAFHATETVPPGPPFATPAANHSALTNLSLRSLFAVVATNPPNVVRTNPFAYRLTNTRQSLEDLARNEHAVLLRNALIDTARPDRPVVPEHLRAKEDPGSYIVQASGPITADYREALAKAGVEIVSYVPNNAFLVRASAEVAGLIRGMPGTQAVLPFEPYYKFDSLLLPLAVNEEPSPYAQLNVVAFPRQTAPVQAQLEKLGAQVTREPEPTTFGDVLTTRVPAEALVAVAQIKEVHMVGVHFDKVPVNDLSRAKLRVSRTTTNRPPNDPLTTQYAAPKTSDYLTGQGVLVAVADTGVDDTHPDLVGRVAGFTTDFDGHGTHVIGSVLGDGTASPLSPAAAAKGSSTQAIFYGAAPKARAYVQDLQGPDALLQRRTALTNALISNNSWGYPVNDYDIFAASYDAAVRDSLPGVTGEQEVLYVFAAGNDGGGGDNGLNGIAGSVLSPATAKNVITVGASDQPRFISNVVSRCRMEPVVTTDTNGAPVTNFVQVCTTNRPWLGQTDSDNQVSGYSSRGNVGIGIEGPFGRFKPDVVAPGSMVVSARSKDYVEPEGSTNTSIYQYNNVALAFNTTNLYALNIPAGAIEVKILTVSNLLSPLTNVDLLIGADIDNVPTTAIATNRLTLDSTTSPPLRQGTLYYTIANSYYSNTTVFDLVVLLTVTNDVGNYYDVLKQLNAPLKPHYRYESGTSMAAPKISGMLALVQEYLGTNFNIRPSPALLKALIINGARSLSANYNLDAHTTINHQGWGIASLSNSIPIGLSMSPTNGPMRFYDQSVTNGLATGGTHVYQINVPNQARSYPLRLSLVWSDPPGNPIAGIKLVNDLNLLVTADTTNVIGGQTNSSSLVWVGNNFPPGSDFVGPILAASTDPDAEVSTNLVQDIENARDLVNNVENIYISPPLSSSYTVVLKGHRVNVNALNSHSNSIVQDYALVISSGNVASTNVNLVVNGPVFTNDPSPRIAALARASNATSAALLNQRVGANAPLIVSTNGATNQWAFFTYTNVPTANFTNVVIFTFFPPELSLPRFREADIDLYVARGSNSTNLFALDPSTVSAAAKSTLRGGTEIVLFSNAQPNEVFSIGVKSEDQQAAQFNIFAASSDRPFSRRDSSNNIVASAFPLPADIPDGTPDDPGGTNIFALVFEPEVNVQRVYVTNSIFHEQAGDLIGILSHRDVLDGGDASVTLNNHATWNGLRTVVYDDSEQGDLGDAASTPPVIPPDGPGRLRDFVGQSAFGLWNFSISDNALFHTGSVQGLTLVIEPASTNSNLPVDLVRLIRPGRWVYAAFNVPADATNVHACASYLSGSGPVELYLRRNDFPTRAAFDKGLGGIVPPGACLDLGLNDSPPLSQGRYYVGVYNAGSSDVKIRLTVEVQRSLTPNRAQTIANNNGTFLIDDATTNSTIFVTNRGFVSSVEVDVRLDHPRISDLALHLVSPQGVRILLAENRGRDTTSGYGWTVSNIVTTNFGARVLDDGFEYALGTGAIPPSTPGSIISGWRVDSGDIDVVHDTYGMLGVSHTGTNGIDLVGNVDGSLSTNVSTMAGKAYRLSFAYCRNPSPATPAVTTARVELNGTPALDVTYGLANSYPVLNWLTTSVVVNASSTMTTLRFRQLSPGAGAGGMFIDTVRMDEVELLTNSALYATFTDDPAKAFIPIKFAPPPFGETNFTGSNIFISGFEGTTGGVRSLGNTFVGWTVRSNDVYVQTNNTLAYSDTNYLLLRTGTVSRVIPTVAGKEYVLQFATRTRRTLLYSTGVDEDRLPLPVGSIDSHYFVSSNSVTRTTNAAYVMQSTSPPMGNNWINRNLPDSRWISVDAFTPPAGRNRYGFRTQFDLTGYNWRNVTLTGRFQVDGSTVAVLLNGANVPSAAIGGTTYSSGFATRTFTNGFVPGLNTLELVLTNSPTPAANTALGMQAQFDPEAIQASSGTLNFDDITFCPGCGFFDLTNGYAGFQWTNFTALNGVLRPMNEGFYTGTTSRSNVAFNSFGLPSMIRRASPFNFDSAYLTAAYLDQMQVRIQGFAGTSLQYSNTYTINRTNPTLINFNYLGVTSVKFEPVPIGNIFVMDNATPEAAVPPITTAVGQIKVVGSYTNFFTALSDTWRVQNVTFVARSNNASLDFTGITPGVWLDHITLRETGRKYYLPEEPLSPLVGQQAFGQWGLEIWDSWLGAVVGNRNLVSWRLNLAYVRTNPPLVLLSNAVPYVGAVNTDGLRYFVVNVPCGNALVTNTLMSLTPPGALDLLFNQDTFPTGSSPPDAILMSNTTSNSTLLNVGLYPLTRSGPYFLGVRNSNPAQNNRFLLRVDINCGLSAVAPFISPSQVTFSDAGVTLKWTGAPDAEFRVEYSDDLTLPWTAFPETIYSETGEFTFTDSGDFSGISLQRFYRLVLIQ